MNEQKAPDVHHSPELRTAFVRFLTLAATGKHAASLCPEDAALLLDHLEAVHALVDRLAADNAHLRKEKAQVWRELLDPTEPTPPRAWLKAIPAWVRHAVQLGAVVAVAAGICLPIAWGLKWWVSRW